MRPHDIAALILAGSVVGLLTLVTMLDHRLAAVEAAVAGVVVQHGD